MGALYLKHLITGIIGISILSGYSGIAAAERGRIWSCPEAEGLRGQYCRLTSFGKHWSQPGTPVSIYSPEGRWAAGGVLVKGRNGRLLIMIEEAINSVGKGYLYEEDTADSLMIENSFSHSPATDTY